MRKATSPLIVLALLWPVSIAAQEHPFIALNDQGSGVIRAIGDADLPRAGFNPLPLTVALFCLLWSFAFVAGHRGFIDDVIMPRATRRRLARSLAMLRDKKLENPWKKHDNIPL